MLSPTLGVDEKAVARRHQYVTMVCDLDRSTVEYIADDRKKTSLDAYYQSLSKEQLAGIEAVAMDMWDPFIGSTVTNVPDGRSKIVFDRYHIMKHMVEAVDTVRKREHRLLQSEGDNTLKGTKYLWLFSEENLPESYVEKFADLRGMHLKTGRAWAIKEALRHLWGYQRKGMGDEVLEALVLLGYTLAIGSRWSKWREMIHSHLDNVSDLLRPSDHQRH